MSPITFTSNDFKAIDPVQDNLVVMSMSSNVASCAKRLLGLSCSNSLSEEVTLSATLQ
ncbi:hypothetical protein JHK84_050381 [Glycine max]|nr:hypothetical protein JHK84_050381 [Glycine max]